MIDHVSETNKCHVGYGRISHRRFTIAIINDHALILVLSVYCKVAKHVAVSIKAVIG